MSATRLESDGYISFNLATFSFLIGNSQGVCQGSKKAFCSNVIKGRIFQEALTLQKVNE